MTIRLPLFFLRQRVVPFETGIAVYCLYSSITALVGFGLTNNMFRSSVPGPISTFFNAAFVVAGLCMFLGIGLGRRDIEGLGLMAVVTSLVIRSVAVTYFFGLDEIVVNGFVIRGMPIVVNTNVTNIIFIVACLIRLESIFAWRILVEMQGRPQSE